MAQLLTGEKSLSGARELDAKLMNLGADLAPKLLRASLGEAMKPTLALWRAAMREGTRMHKTYKGRLVAPGFSRRNSIVYTQVARDNSRASATVGPKDEAFYNLWFVETVGWQGGKGKRNSRGGSRHGIKVKPDPKLEPAFKATRSVILSSFVGALRKRIDRAAKKTGRPAAV